LPPRRFWLAATELAPLWSQGGVEEERFLRLHRRGGRPAARQTMILAMTRKRRTMIPDGARWTRYRQAGESIYPTMTQCDTSPLPFAAFGGVEAPAARF